MGLVIVSFDYWALNLGDEHSHSGQRRSLGFSYRYDRRYV